VTGRLIRFIASRGNKVEMVQWGVMINSTQGKEIKREETEWELTISVSTTPGCRANAARFSFSCSWLILAAIIFTPTLDVALESAGSESNRKYQRVNATSMRLSDRF
jgi:hypothetical protein